MCWLPIDQPLLLPSDSTCSVRRHSPCSVAQLLAFRLRMIGDQLEKGWAAEDPEGGYRCREVGVEVAEVVTGGGHRLKRFLCTVMRFTVRVLFAARRHL